MALPVNFDPNAAIRIYNAVRKVEAGDRDQKPLTFDRVMSENPKVFKVCKFSGSWATGTNKTVSLATAPGITLSALNLFYPITGSPTNAFCAVAKSQGTWFLLSVPFQTATGFLATGTAASLRITPSDTVTSTVLTPGATSTAIVMTAGSTQSASVVSGSPASASFVSGVTAVLNTANCDISITLSTGSISYFGAGNTSTIQYASTGSTQLLSFLSPSGTATAVTISPSATATVSMLTGTSVWTFLRLVE